MRAFIAVPLPDVLKKNLFCKTAGLRETDLNMRWVPQGNMHITMKFLGDIDESRSTEIANLLAGFAGAIDPFVINLTGFGTFPPRGRPRILYADTDQQRRMRALADQLEQKLSALGFSVEGRFKSHVTLARFKDNKHPGRFFQNLEQIRLSGAFEVKEFRLMKSVLSSSGASYEIMARAFFKS